MKMFQRTIISPNPAQFPGPNLIQMDLTALNQPPVPSSDLPRSIRYLALGDSYTIGEAVPEEERWPNQLARLLRSYHLKTEVTIIARTGWTTDELWAGIRDRQIQPPYDLVSLLIGVNNQYRGWGIDVYEGEFRFLVEKSIEYAGGNPRKVIVLSIPDWGVTPFASDRNQPKIASEVDAFNAVNREETERAGASYVDITPYSRFAAVSPSLVAEDGLHPSGKMYAGWAEMALGAARKALGK